MDHKKHAAEVYQGINLVSTYMTSRKEGATGRGWSCVTQVHT